MVTDRELHLQSRTPSPSHADIAALAYSLWHERGCPLGSPEVDWRNAENKLRGHAVSTDSSVGATEDQVNMQGTVGHHIDRNGTNVEDIAGTGEIDSPGG